MKARLVSYYRKLYLLCSDGSVEAADEEVLKKMFVGFYGAEHFHGKSGRWDTKYATIEECPGKNMAWVDDEGRLIIVENVFIPLVQTVVDNDYISVREYAEENGLGETRVKVLCRESRISGAMKKGKQWFIPRSAPLPPDARYSGVEK